jgi:hypothetical protein
MQRDSLADCEEMMVFRVSDPLRVYPPAQTNSAPAAPPPLQPTAHPPASSPTPLPVPHPTTQTPSASRVAAAPHTASASAPTPPRASSAAPSPPGRPRLHHVQKIPHQPPQPAHLTFQPPHLIRYRRVGQRRPHLGQQPLEVLRRQHPIQHCTYHHSLYLVGRHIRRIAGGCPQPPLPSAPVVPPAGYAPLLTLPVPAPHHCRPTTPAHQQPRQPALTPPQVLQVAKLQP